MSYMCSVAAALADGQIHSGSALAQKIGISRTAVWETIRKIQSAGLNIRAIQGKGYRLVGASDSLDEFAIRQCIGDMHASLCERLEIHTVLDSTSDYLLRCMRLRSIHRHVVLAHCQTAGRGRRGHQWLSPFGGGLYLSLGVHFDHMVIRPPQFSLLVGVAIIRALADHVPAKIQLKWPNDIIFDQRKLGGVLLDVRGEAGGPCDVIIGIGINIRLPEAVRQRIDQPWIELAAITGQVPSKNQLAASVIKRVYTLLQNDLMEEGFNLVREWPQYDALMGKHAVLLCRRDRTIRGIVRGVNRSGDLLFCVNGKLRRYRSGELRLRAQP